MLCGHLGCLDKYLFGLVGWSAWAVPILFQFKLPKGYAQGPEGELSRVVREVKQDSWGQCVRRRAGQEDDPHRAVIQICELLEAPAEQVQPLAVAHRVLLGPKNIDVMGYGHRDLIQGLPQTLRCEPRCHIFWRRHTSWRGSGCRWSGPCMGPFLSPTPAPARA